MHTLFHTFTTFIAILTFTVGGAFAATKIGVVGSSNPSVTAVSETGDTRTLKAGDVVFLNDKITTTAKGSAQLMFLDKSALTVSPNSSITVDTFVYDPASKDGTMSLQSAKGAFRFIGGALTKKKPVKIKTPVSTIGIRGGIVDTHIANSGQTDAIFLFGKEMTMTNQNGQTTSTTDFGTGFSLADGAGVPVDLPKGAIINHMNNSPVASSASKSQGSGNSKAVNKAINNKLNINDKSKSDDKGANNSKSEGSAFGGGTTPSGKANNNNGGDNHPANDTADKNGQGGPLEPVATAGDTPPAPEGGDTPPAPSNAFGFGTSPEGTAPTGGTAQEDLRNDVETFVKTEGDKPLFDLSKVDKTKLKDRFGTFNTGDKPINKDGENTQPPLPPVNETPIVKDEPPVEDDEEIVVCLGCHCTNSCAPPPTPRINTDQTITTPTLNGFYGNTIRDNSTGVASYEDDGHLIGEIIGVGATERFALELEGLNAGADIDDVEVKTKNPGTGSIPNAQVGYWDDTGEVSGWSGSYLVTHDKAFSYYDMEHADGTDTQHTRMIILDSDLLNTNHGSAANAQLAIDNAVAESRINSSFATNGVIEYQFLNDLMGVFDGNGTDVYGNYNGYGSKLSNPREFGFAQKGLLVDYNHKQFMGGFINFAGSHPSMSLSVGEFDPSGPTTSGGYISGGNFLNGATYTSNAVDFDSDGSIQTNEFSGRNGDFIVGADTLAYKETVGTDDIISGMMVDSLLDLHKDPANDVEAHQGLVATSGGSSFIDNSIDSMAASTTVSYQGFSAGLLMKGSGEIGRIKTANAYDVDVDITKNVGGDGVTVNAAINTYVVDNTGPLGGSTKNYNFGGSYNNSSAIELDTYGAEFTTGNADNGAIVAMQHNSDVNVCSSCQFAHWGVWSAYDEGGTVGDVNDDIIAGLVPYVAGDVTDITGAAIGPGGVHTYNGDIAANTVDAAGNISNATGTFASTIDLSNRRVQAYNGNVAGMSFGFNATDTTLHGIAANSLVALSSAVNPGLATGGYDFNAATDTFNAEVVNTGAGGIYDIQGNINGALFGSNGEEVGGNFYIEHTINGDKAAGIYLGTR